MDANSNSNTLQNWDGELDLPKLKIDDLVALPNIAEKFTSEQRDALGKIVVNAFMVDLASRQDWEQNNAEAIKLAMQVREAKNFPWTNCSNVKFPLLTIASLQFLARISLMTKGRKLARLEPIGVDPEGTKAQRAKRISTHISSQLVDEDVSWLDQDEAVKLEASIIGASFKKTYWDPIHSRLVSEQVPAKDFVVDYYCTDIDKASRATQTLSLSLNDIQSRVRSGIYLELDSASWGQSPSRVSLLAEASNDSMGVEEPATSPLGNQSVLEQHCWLDLDGDGYAEPYVISVHEASCQILRIVARYFNDSDTHRVFDAQMQKLDNEALMTDDMQEQSSLEKESAALLKRKDNHIICIDPSTFFTRYLFIPSPDGGVYGQGLGSLLGPTNEAVNTLMNQLIDAGTMSNTAGGFLGRGVKMKGGTSSFSPFEWKPVDSTGNDLRNNIFPLPVRDPSAVLFQLLGMLVTYGEKISGSTDIMTGVSPGQNTPAETSRNTVEQGMMLFSGIYNRMYRSFRAELRKIYELNRIYLSSSPQFLTLTTGADALLAKDDYKGHMMRIFPAASSEAVSQGQVKDKATQLLTMANSMPGFNKYQVTLDWLDAHGYDDIERIFPDPQGKNAIPAGEDPKIALQKAELEQSAKEHQDGMQLAIANLEMDKVKLDAEVTALMAKSTMLLAQARGVDTGHQIAMIDSQIGAAKLKQSGIAESLKILHDTAQQTRQHMHEQLQADKQIESAKAAAGHSSKSKPQPESNDGAN